MIWGEKTLFLETPMYIVIVFVCILNPIIDHGNLSWRASRRSSRWFVLNGVKLSIQQFQRCGNSGLVVAPRLESACSVAKQNSRKDHFPIDSNISNEEMY